MYTVSQFEADQPEMQTYASDPVDASYVQMPTLLQQQQGVAPLDLAPAQWWNAYLQRFTQTNNATRKYLQNVMAELSNFVGGSDGTADLQVKEALENRLREPDWIKGDMISLNQIETDHLVNSAVTTAKINNLAVTTAKLAERSVTNTKMGIGAVTGAGEATAGFNNGNLALGTVGLPNLAQSVLNKISSTQGLKLLANTTLTIDYSSAIHFVSASLNVTDNTKGNALLVLYLGDSNNIQTNQRLTFLVSYTSNLATFTTGLHTYANLGGIPSSNLSFPAPNCTGVMYVPYRTSNAIIVSYPAPITAGTIQIYAYLLKVA